MLQEAILYRLSHGSSCHMPTNGSGQMCQTIIYKAMHSQRCLDPSLPSLSVKLEELD